MYHRRFAIFRRVLRLSLPVFVVSTLFAQLDTGAIDVTVTDSSGSVIPGASVVLHNEKTNMDARSATTNDQGVSNFALIPSGVYTVRWNIQASRNTNAPASCCR